MNRWLQRERRDQGAIVALPVVWRLAKAWYADPRDPNWQPRTRDESQAVLASVGLSGEFWELPRKSTPLAPTSA